MTLEKMIVHIIQDVAQGEVACDEMGYECIYCGERDGKWNEYAIKIEDYTEKIEHKPDCTILLARKVFREQGTPLNIYRMSAEQWAIFPPKRKHGEWHAAGGHTLAISEQAAIDSWQSEKMHNIKAEFIAVLPEQEDKQP